MKAIRLFIFLFIAVSFIACSKGKWDIQPKNELGNGLKIKVNGNVLEDGKSISIGKFEKDQATDFKVALMLTDSLVSAEKTYNVKPVTSPSNDGDVMLVKFTGSYDADSNYSITASVTGAELK